VIAGWLIGHGAGDLYIAQLVVGCAAVVWVAIRLEATLPPGVNGVPVPQTDEAPVSGR
jgi:hypothetical protein